MSPCVKHGCAACCYDTEMPVTQEDVARLTALGHRPEDFTTRGAQGWLQLNTVDPEEDMPGRPCFFLKDNRCTVYAVRPQGCRIYPLVINEQQRLLRDEDCPHRVEFALDPAAKRRIQRIMSTLRREAR